MYDYCMLILALAFMLLLILMKNYTHSTNIIALLDLLTWTCTKAYLHGLGTRAYYTTCTTDAGTKNKHIKQ